MAIRTIIVDDMDLARQRLLRHLSRHEDIDIVGQYANGETAIAAIASLCPDLLFLDVQMPGCDGFEVARSLGEDCRPEIVFVTAFDQFAIRAFEVHAVDYLLKPFSDERLDSALANIRRRLTIARQQRGMPELAELLEAVRGYSKRPMSIVLRTNGRSVVVPQADIDWIEAAGNYLTVHVGRESHMVRETMTQFEQRLDPHLFARIHRSAIVNASRVRELHPLFNGDQEIVLREGQRLTMSRTHREKLLQLLGVK
jgi:two-component system LytT family response regulator